MPATEERVISEYKTSDLGLAAYLDLCGHTYQRLERRGRQVIWVFDRNESLEDCVDQFQNREAEVEPIAYHSRLAESRRDMFDFLKPAT